MSRFFVLKFYRGLLQLAAILVILGGLYLAWVASAVEQYNNYEYYTTHELDRFLGSFMVFALIALFLLVASELIKLFLFIENHLYHLRYPDLETGENELPEETFVTILGQKGLALTAQGLKVAAEKASNELERRANEKDSKNQQTPPKST